MSMWYHRSLILLLLLTVSMVQAQFDPKKVCRVEDGRLIFTLDQRWSTAQRREVSRMFDLDSMLLVNAFALKPMIKDSCILWKVRKIDTYHIELSGEPCKNEGTTVSQDKILLLDDPAEKGSPAGERESVPYGVNRLTRNTIVQLSPGVVRFFMPGSLKSKKVFLSGSFNGWSTFQTPLLPCDSGWTVTLKLLPGKYTYKYIIDGKWTNDSYNKLTEEDAYHRRNSVFFCYNYKFVLNGYPEAHKVILAASFNQWNESNLQMIRFKGSWVLPLYLRDGTHAYKFIIDGNWITDPANKITRPDGRGNMNSFMGIGDTLFFTLMGYTGAKKVVVSGNFNAWNREELTMSKTSGGWKLPYVLASGNYEYKFLVDGRWITDPANPFTTGTGNTLNSYLTVKPNYWFRLEQYADADVAIVTGSFNNWSTHDYRMELRQGTWWFPLYLIPGKYTYKFIVDNKWIIDPANKLWEDNEYGTGNSVLWIGP